MDLETQLHIQRHEMMLGCSEVKKQGDQLRYGVYARLEGGVNSLQKIFTHGVKFLERDLVQQGLTRRVNVDVYINATLVWMRC